MRYYRKIIRIRAEDSPNVRRGFYELSRGLPISNEEIVKGVLTYDEYLKRRSTWDDVRQCIGLDANFWEGKDVLMFPPDWLNRAERIYDRLGSQPRKALGIGCDPAEGGDKTAMAAVDNLGLIELVSKKTPNTSVVTGELLAFMVKHNCTPDRVCIDRGGGGKEHADRMRSNGHNIRTVAFGEVISLDPRRGSTHEIPVAGFSSKLEIEDAPSNALSPREHLDV